MVRAYVLISTQPGKAMDVVSHMSGQDGIVQSQSPEGGSQATKGSTVTIVIGQHSPGPPPTTTTTG